VRRSIAFLISAVLAVPFAALAADPPAAAPAAADAAGGKGQPGAVAPKGEDPMVGEVVVLPYNRTAAYSVSRVTGPNVNVTDDGDGTWKGNIKDFSGVFKVTETRISAAGINMVMDRDGDDWVCQGTVDGKRVRFAMGKEGFVARYDNRLYDLKRVQADLWASIPTGPAVRVKGDAQGMNPFYPQFILALLATL
jgi:hypothetical protein